MTALWRSRSSTRRTPPSSPTMGSRSTSSKARTRTSRSRPRRISRWQDSSCDPRRTTMSKTALVTGASRGIGLETARRFILNHDDITTVVMFARDSEDFDEAVRQLESELPIGRRIVPIKVDVGARPALKKAVKQVYDQVGNIDILVNNAGYTNPVPLQQVKMSDFEKTMEVNLYSPFTIVKTLLNSVNTFDLIGRRIVPIKVDVGARPALKKAVKQVYDQVGNIDILVNNAGYTNPVPLQQVKMSDFEKTMEVNLYGPFTIVKTLLNRGNTFDLIVNIASTAGINGRSGWLTYSASKAAVINMSQVMREELSIYGTRVVCLS